MRSLAREESEESPEESDLKKLASVTAHLQVANLRFESERKRSRAEVTEPWRRAVPAS